MFWFYIPLGPRLRLWWMKKRMFRLARVAAEVDELLLLNKYTRAQRREFWRAFFKRAKKLDELMHGIDWSLNP